MDKIVTTSKRRWLRPLLLTLLGVLTVGIGVLLAGWIWYGQQLKPVGDETSSLVTVTIVPASSPDQIAQKLHEEKVIRNKTAFLLHTRLEGVQGKLQAGTYRLSPAESTPEIVKHLVSGKVDTFTVTFYPGATLVDNSSKPLPQKQDITSSLLRAGFESDEIKEALQASYPEYDQTLFEGRPSTADLEGYIYGDTYKLSSGATVKDVLRASFAEYWRVIQQNSLVAAFAEQDLSLYQGIILASIVQRESVGGDEAGIAGVFFNRIAAGDRLGSDVTYQYIADKTGVPRDPNLDSPYNTRRYVGLPPGPIASPGLAALKSVGSPADSDYYYFLSGDDDVTYFARTFAEHEANIRNHCQAKCQIL